jgi:predicted regulator of Ras-like GTPase activity (Roadblock/LC7/MglB family)
MDNLAKDLGTQSVMLTDRAGMTLVEVGTATNLPMMIVLPLLSTGFSTTGEVARQLGEEDATSVYIHEGMNIDLYCFDVMQRFLLVLVFDKKVVSHRSKIGSVWINAKRAMRELRDAF